MKKLLTLSLLSVICHSSLKAQVSQALNTSEILRKIRKLETVGSVLYIAAHPDDENTRLLAYLANERQLRTGYLSLTRGDGGQNLIGPEQGELLGLIRTQELLAARRTDGAEQFFTRAKDFGYSKNPEETFSFWNKDSILSDVVLTIRKFKPDVIICRFPTTGEGGHGHHTASAILALEAFDAAADPRRFPEQLRYTQVWQSRRIFWNTFNFGTTNTTAPDQLKTDIGAFNPLIGKSYGEIASESRSMHKSQGFGSARQRGSLPEYFKLMKGDSAKSDILEGINTGWSRLPGTEGIQQNIASCIRNYDPQAPEKSIPALSLLYRSLQSFPARDETTAYWKELKLKETEQLLLACSGLWIECFAADYSGVPGQELLITTQILNRNRSGASLHHITFAGLADTSLNLSLQHNELYTFKRQIRLPDTHPYSEPYWLSEPHHTGLYTVKSAALIGSAENEAAVKVSFQVRVQDMILHVQRDLVYKYTDPVKGEVYRPFEVLPPVTVNIPEKVFVFTDLQPKTVLLTVRANQPDISATLRLRAGQGWNIQLKNPEIRLARKGDETIVEALITPARQAPAGTLEASLITGTGTYHKSIRRIEYDHIPYQFTLSQAEAGLVYIDLKKRGHKIGYIPGAGDDVAACLKQIGYQVTLLDDDMLGNSDLSAYTAIITGVRAYNTNERLQVHHERLMNYVKNGGNLIVQYNTNSRVGPLTARIGPYPFSISRNRVTDEKAEVRFLKEKHPALNTPNQISAGDFEGWVQERGIYFAEKMDEKYESVLSMNDPGESPHEGSLIIGKYGAGNFVYTGLVFFRELPAGVPGAYRLLVNLLSLPKNK